MYKICLDSLFRRLNGFANPIIKNLVFIVLIIGLALGGCRKDDYLQKPKQARIPRKAVKKANKYNSIQYKKHQTDK